MLDSTRQNLTEHLQTLCPQLPPISPSPQSLAEMIEMMSHPPCSDLYSAEIVSLLLAPLQQCRAASRIQRTVRGHQTRTTKPAAAAAESQQQCARLPEIDPESIGPVQWPFKGKFTKIKNRNLPQGYSWCDEDLHLVANNQAHTIHARAMDCASTMPLFVVAGSCPFKSGFMNIEEQIVMFSKSKSSQLSSTEWWHNPFALDVRFWFLKPHAKNRKELAQRDLHGSYNNTPKLSKKLYAVFADMFREERSTDDTRCTIEDVAEGRRAAITLGDEPPMFLYFIWIESFSDSILSTKQFVRGKIAYQRDPLQPVYFCRTYHCQMENKTIPRMQISKHEQGPFGPGTLPSNVIKDATFSNLVENKIE